jgi:hypothetical protein
MASIGAAVHGWDQTGSNGANLSFPRQCRALHRHRLHRLLAERPSQLNDRSSWRHLCRRGHLSDRSDRFRIDTELGATLHRPSYPWNGHGPQGINSADLERVSTLRLLRGCLLNLFRENVPASIRGGLVMSWQMWDAFGSESSHRAPSKAKIGLMHCNSFSGVLRESRGLPVRRCDFQLERSSDR